MAVSVNRTVQNILISQPEPQHKSPYARLEEKCDVTVNFEPFIEVEGVDVREFRKSRVHITDYQSVIFTSRNAMDHFFRISGDLRLNMSQETKYFCISEAIALYLQKHIQYRKRKVFYGNGSIKEFKELLMKYKESSGRILYPCSDVRKAHLPEFLAENDFDYSEAVLYRTVATDLAQVDLDAYDMLVFFSPSGVKSLFKNFPDFEQGDTSIATYGPTTSKIARSMGLRLDIEAPTEKARSMSMAIEHFLKE